MIHSLRIDGQTIPIAPPSVVDDPSSNIFSANSMMLFIGPNGAGKTTLLHRVAETALQGDALDVACDSDLSKLRVVYLTLSPFGKPEPSVKDKRRKLMFRASVDDPVIPEAGLFKTLSRAFTLPGKVELKLEERVAEGLRFLIRSATNGSRLGWLKGPASVVAQIAAVDTLYDEALQMRRNENMSYADWFKTPVYAAFQVAEAERDRAIGRYLRGQLAEDFEIQMWALALALPRTEGRRASALRFFLRRFGFEVERPPPAKAVRERFASQLRALRALGNQLAPLTGDPLLRKGRYTFGLERLDDVKGISLGAYAKVQLAGASTGMAALFAQFSLLQKGINELGTPQPGDKNDLLLLVDEGDVFLHIAWQQRYVKALDAYVESLRESFGCVQVVMTTHSPVMMSDFPRDHILRIGLPPTAQDTEAEDAWDWDDRLSGVDIAFGAPLETIVRETGGAGTMGSFAEAVIERLIDDVRAGKPVPQARIDMIDDPVLRRLLNSAGMRRAS